MTQKVNRRDLIEAALLRKRLGRLPCFPIIDVAYASAHAGLEMSLTQQDPIAHASALATCVRELPVDGVYINLCLSAEQSAGGVWAEDALHVKLDNCLHVRIPRNDVISIERTEIETLEDSRIFEAALFHPGMLTTYQALQAQMADSAALVVGLTGTFSQLAFLVGLERLLLAAMDNPGAVECALRQRHETTLRQARELCAAGARFVWIGEGIASGNIMSPRMYRRFVLPYQQALTSEIREHGALSILHVCGNITPMLPEITVCGADGCDVDYLTDWPVAVRLLAPRLCVKGNINPLLFLPGDHAGLEDACRQAIREARHAPGFMLSSGCLVPRDSDAASFDLFARASRLGSC